MFLPIYRCLTIVLPDFSQTTELGLSTRFIGTISNDASRGKTREDQNFDLASLVS